MNRYKNAGGNEKPYFQIICPECGMKDATSDKDSWTCPNCEDKAKAKARVVAGARAAIASPRTSPQLKAALTSIANKIEGKIVEVKQEPVVEEVAAADDFMSAFRTITGVKEAQPAKIVKEFKVGGLQCKIVSTNRK